MRGRLQILNSDTCVQPNFSPLEWTSDHCIGKGCSSKFETSTATIRKFSKSKISLQWVMSFSIIFLGLSLLSFSQGVSFILTWTWGIYEWEWSLVICKHLWSLSEVSLFQGLLGVTVLRWDLHRVLYCGPDASHQLNLHHIVQEICIDSVCNSL